MASQGRKHRGLRTQKVVADWFKANGFPYAESTGAGRSGVDITGMVGIAIECKARTGFDPLAWLRQAHEYADLGLPIVVFRPNGMGESSVGQWGALVRLETLTRLVREAGYGDPLVPEGEGAEAHHADQSKATEQEDGGSDGDKGLTPAPKRHRLPKRAKELPEQHDIESTA